MTIKPVWIASASALFLANGLLANGGNAWAQQVPSPPAPVPAPTDAPIVTVLGKSLPLPPGTPAYGSVLIVRDRLENNASGMIESVLTDIAGFQQFRRSDSRSANPSAQGATLRALGGNASSRTLVLLDGVPMADPFFGYIPFTALVPDRLSLIRVTRGGGSGAFGAGAVAGTIELASAGRDELPLASASAAYGSYGSSQIAATVAPGLGEGFASLSGRWDRSDGFQTTPPAQRVAATAPARYSDWSANARAVAPLSGTSEIQFRATVFRDTRTLRFAGADNLSQGEDASIRFISRGAWKIDALAYVQARNFASVTISSTTFRPTLNQRATPSTGLGGKVEVRPPVGRDHVLRLGADWRHATGMTIEDALNATSGAVTARRRAGGDQMTVGLFAEDDWTLGRLVLTGGIRGDRWSISNGRFQTTNAAGGNLALTRYANSSAWEVTGRAGALLHAGDTIALRAAGYTGFRLPTLNELYRGFTVVPVMTNANAALKPERLEGVEAGLDLAPLPAIRLSATAFVNRLRDAIANVTIGPNLRQRQNVDAIVARGVELTGSAQLGQFRLDASYAYSHSRVHAPGQAFDRLRPSQSPAHSASATLGWSMPAGPALSTTVRYVSRQYEDDLQTTALPGALTVDALASIAVGRHWRIVGRVENLFDRKVITRNSGGTLDYGTPRILWIGFRATT